MKWHVAAALALTLACAPALAQKGDSSAPPKLWAGAERIVWAEAEHVPDSGLVLLGKLAVDLEHSWLKHLAETLGGRQQQSGDASTALKWVCLHLDGDTSDTRLWLTSDEISGGRVNSVALARLAASAAPDATCPALKPQYAAIRLPGDLRLGASEAAVRKQLGPTSWDKGGIVAFNRTFDVGVPPSAGGPCQLSIAVWFRFEAGVATALELGRSGGC